MERVNQEFLIDNLSVGTIFTDKLSEGIFYINQGYYFDVINSLYYKEKDIKREKLIKVTQELSDKKISAEDIEKIYLNQKNLKPDNVVSIITEDEAREIKMRQLNNNGNYFISREYVDLNPFNIVFDENVEFITNYKEIIKLRINYLSEEKILVKGILFNFGEIIKGVSIYYPIYASYENSSINEPSYEAIARKIRKQ